MKKNLLALLLLGIPFILFPQKIESPRTGFSTAPYVRIKSVEITDTATILSFHTTFRPGWWIKIPEDTFIRAGNDTVKLYVTRTEGIPLGEEFYMPPSGETEYKVIFPPVDPSVASIDYSEEKGRWKILDIRIARDMVYSIPEEFYGHWFMEGVQWNLSLLDTLAVYDGQIWSYGDRDIQKKRGMITLESGPEKRTIHYRKGKHGVIYFGETPRHLREYTRATDFSRPSAAADNDFFTEPLFRADTTVINGYIKGYSPRLGVRTGMIHVNDLIRGEQDNILLSINEDGTFRARVPLYYPHSVFIRSDIFRGEIFIEPGEEAFILIDPALAADIPEYKDNAMLFMGRNPEINRWLGELRELKWKGFIPQLEASYDEWKTSILGRKQEVLGQIGKLHSEGRLGSNAYRFFKTDIKYSFYTAAISYEMDIRRAQRMASMDEGIPMEDMPEVKMPDPEQYTFLNDELVNSQSAIISNDYYFFLNRLQYLRILHERQAPLFTLDILRFLKEEGFSLTREEYRLDSLLGPFTSTEFREIEKNLVRFSKKSDSLINIYKDHADKLSKTGKPVTLVEIAQILERDGITLNEEDARLIEEWERYDNMECVRRHREIMQKEETQTLISKLHNERPGMIFREKSIRNIKKNLEEFWGIDSGLATDIIYAQAQCRSIVGEFNHVSGDELERIQSEIQDPFIREYIAISNEAVKRQIEINKLKSGFVIGEVPQTEPEHLFDEMMKKYRGKVVFVDFWATWCGPCRAGMQRMKPLKEELGGMDIAFVYITSPSSPRGTWENMITDIPGNHYYVSGDEWNQFSAHFNISGIPHYVLVGKKGEVISPRLGHMDNTNLKNLLMEHMNN
jgi:thiol-disulfide isomerase/thioredoxin